MRTLIPPSTGIHGGGQQAGPPPDGGGAGAAKMKELSKRKNMNKKMARDDFILKGKNTK
jgi:hypothetical protein